MNDNEHYCTAAVCKLVIPKTLLMCKEHWKFVPIATRNAVNRTWRAWRQELVSPEKLRAYEAARREAIAFVDALDALEAAAPV